MYALIKFRDDDVVSEIADEKISFGSRKQSGMKKLIVVVKTGKRILYKQ